MITGCFYFKVIESSDPAPVVISNMQDEQKFIILHMGDKVWHLTDIVLNEEFAAGNITELQGHQKYLTAKPDVVNRYKAASIKETKVETEVLNEVHIYVTEFSETTTGQISIPMQAIKKIEIYGKASGATAASWIFSTLGYGTVAFIVLLILTFHNWGGCSCPFVYSYDGTHFIFNGEILSGATQPGLERDDWLPLHMIASKEGTYKLKLTNEVHEIQSVNYAGLTVIDHSENVSVLIDKYGISQTIKEPVKPTDARNKAGRDILSLIEARDTLYYSGERNSTDEQGIEEIVMKFVRPQEVSKSAKLIIRAKNSFWLEILFSKFHKFFGDRYGNFAEKQESVSGRNLNKFLLDQNIPLSVYLEKNGKWEFVDYFNIAGPMALRGDILSIDLNGITSDTVKIKLETGFLFWEIDYSAMDFSKNEKVDVAELAPNIAQDQNGNDARELLIKTDENYLVLRNVGDEVLLDFKEPARQHTGRTIFLHTSGYYKILREQSGPSDKKTLKTFRKPNRFPQFSKEMYDLLPVD
jgi:hypothetical protein